jgi:hypothetical protein
VKWLETNLLSSTSFGNSQTDTENGVGTEFSLVGGAVQAVKEFVDLRLILHIEIGFDNLGRDDRVHVLDGLENALAAPFGLVAIAKLTSLVLALPRLVSNLFALF